MIISQTAMIDVLHLTPSQAKFEQEQAKWVEKMNVLNSRSAATDKVLEELQELEKATPDAESMPDSLLLEKESITQQAANRVSGTVQVSIQWTNIRQMCRHAWMIDVLRFLRTYFFAWSPHCFHLI